MRIIHITLAILFFVAPCQSVFGEETDFRVVINQGNETINVDHKLLADIFFKKVTRWQNDKGILPVDLIADSQTRTAFSEEILNRPISAVRIYWQQLLFSGRNIPPPELKSDKDVIDFVSSHDGAIGYVSSGADVHRVKVVSVR